MGISYIKNYLFAEPSTIGGIASIIDLGATLQEYNYDQTPNEADINAIANDWRAIGADISHALSKQHEATSTATK